MALMDRFREAWEDLRFNNRKEEQEPAGQFHNAEHQPIAREAALVQALPSHALESSQAVAVPLGPVRAEGLARQQSISL